MLRPRLVPTYGDRLKRKRYSMRRAKQAAELCETSACTWYLVAVGALPKFDLGASHLFWESIGEDCEECPYIDSCPVVEANW